MPQHDIIDNLDNTLKEKISEILPASSQAHFAVGYFFLSGLHAVEEHLDNLKELRLLIGNTGSRSTLEQLAEAYSRLTPADNINREQSYQADTEAAFAVDATKLNLRKALELTEQTDANEKIAHTVFRLISDGKLNVKVYTKGRLHAKAYIFDYGPAFDADGKQLPRETSGVGIVGSSNFTLSGLTHNTELNVMVRGNANHSALLDWFNRLWEEAKPFDKALMEELQESWALKEATPYDIYMKSIYELVKDRLVEDEHLIWDDPLKKALTKFQEQAVRVGVSILRTFNGVFIADVVGLGKSFIGAAILKYLIDTQDRRALIICPKALEEDWKVYNEEFRLNAIVVPMSMLKHDRDADNDVDDESNCLLDHYETRNLVLVDESHNFRNPDTQRYRVLQGFLDQPDMKTVLLTATPRNKSAWDIYNQIKLFQQTDHINLPIDPQDLKKYFKLIEKGEREIQGLLRSILIRRKRNDILRGYGFDSETDERVDPKNFQPYKDGRKRAYILVQGRKQYFPKRKLTTLQYSIDETYKGLYQEIRHRLGGPAGIQARNEDELYYARYGLWNYVSKKKQKVEPYKSLHSAGINLRGLMRSMLFKRFESSVYAFRETIRRISRVHANFLEALERGFVPAGEEAQELLGKELSWEEQDLADALAQVSEKYDIEDFNADALKADIEHDLVILREIHDLVSEERIPPGEDAKLQKLLATMKHPDFRKGKLLIFTQYADTAYYLGEHMGDLGRRKEVIYSSQKRKMDIVGRFSPKFNPQYAPKNKKDEIDTLVATDILAEGLNLQDCDKIINYDLHWNPVKLIQRFGRIDRIGTEFDEISGCNFLPETALDRHLGLTGILRGRIQEIHDTIGEDAQILDETERLNELALYAIYEEKGDQLGLFEEEDQEADLNELEEKLRAMKRDEEDEYKRIVELRDGIRSGLRSTTKGTYVLMRQGSFHKIFLIDKDGSPKPADVGTALGIIKAEKVEPAHPLPAGYNEIVMKAKKLFENEMKERESEAEHLRKRSRAQEYITRDLKKSLKEENDPDRKAVIEDLIEAFGAIIGPTLDNILKKLRRQKSTGKDLVERLIFIYHKHGLADHSADQEKDIDEPVVIVCSEALG